MIAVGIVSIISTRPSIAVGEYKKARPNAPNTDAENEREMQPRLIYGEDTESRLSRLL